MTAAFALVTEEWWDGQSKDLLPGRSDTSRTTQHSQSNEIGTVLKRPSKSFDHIGKVDGHITDG